MAQLSTNLQNKKVDIVSLAFGQHQHIEDNCFSVTPVVDVTGVI